MIPERIYTRPNVAPRYYCCHCGTQLHDEKASRWMFCPMCGKDIEWRMAREINLREVNCAFCKKPLIFWRESQLSVSPSFCGSNMCRECRISNCAQTNCLDCKDGRYTDCQWAYLKRLAIAKEMEL